MSDKIILPSSSGRAESYGRKPPAASKYLQPDGSITTGDGAVVAPPNEGRAKSYSRKPPQAAKWLLPDGSITSVPFTDYVSLGDTQEIDGVKVFLAPPVVPEPLENGDAVNKEYVDRLKEYAQELNIYVDGVKEYADGIKAYTDGVKEYADGLKLHVDGLSQYVSGLNGYIGGVKAYVDRIADMVTYGRYSVTPLIDGISCEFRMDFAIKSTMFAFFALAADGKVVTPVVPVNRPIKANKFLLEANERLTVVMYDLRDVLTEEDIPVNEISWDSLLSCDWYDGSMAEHATLELALDKFDEINGVQFGALKRKVKENE